MKKYDGVLKKVRIQEEKKGIYYAKPSGSLYKNLRRLYNFFFAYAFIFNALFIASIFVNIDAGIISGGQLDSVYNCVIIVAVGTVLTIAGLILLYKKLYLAAGITSAIPIVLMLVFYANQMQDSFEGFLGLRPSFYWRHGAPLSLMLILMIVLVLIALRAEIKTNEMYKKVTENLFNEYKQSVGEDVNISEAEWEEKLKNYQPDNSSFDNKKNKKSEE